MKPTAILILGAAFPALVASIGTSGYSIDATTHEKTNCISWNYGKGDVFYTEVDQSCNSQAGGSSLVHIDWLVQCSLKFTCNDGTTSTRKDKNGKGVPTGGTGLNFSTCNGDGQWLLWINFVCDKK